MEVVGIEEAMSNKDAGAQVGDIFNWRGDMALVVKIEDDKIWCRRLKLSLEEEVEVQESREGEWVLDKNQQWRLLDSRGKYI